MPIKMQEVLDRARRPLKDAAKRRINDTDFLAYANAAIARAYAIRPDLRFGSYGTPVTALAKTDDFPLPLTYMQAVANYATAMSEVEEDDETHASRAAAFMALFEKELMQ